MGSTNNKVHPPPTPRHLSHTRVKGFHMEYTKHAKTANKTGKTIACKCRLLCSRIREKKKQEKIFSGACTHRGSYHSHKKKSNKKSNNSNILNRTLSGLLQLFLKCGGKVNIDAVLQQTLCHRSVSIVTSVSFKNPLALRGWTAGQPMGSRASLPTHNLHPYKNRRGTRIPHTHSRGRTWGAGRPQRPLTHGHRSRRVRDICSHHHTGTSANKSLRRLSTQQLEKKNSDEPVQQSSNNSPISEQNKNISPAVANAPAMGVAKSNHFLTTLGINVIIVQKHISQTTYHKHHTTNKL